MIRNCKRLVAGTICVLLPLFAGAAVAAPPPAALDSLMELLRAKGIITAEEGKSVGSAASASGTISRSDLKGVVELLRSKGVITAEEAAAFLQEITAQQVQPPQAEAVKPAEAKAAEPLEAESPEIGSASTPIPDEELKPTIETLREQGMLGADEAAQIVQRIGRTWSPADEDEPIAPPDLEIEFSRTTLPKESLLADLAQLKRQKLLTADEEGRIRKRFLQKVALERVTSDIGEEARREIRNQVEARIPALPDWVKRVKLGGDMRLRYQGEYFDSNNAIDIPKPDDPSSALNTQTNRDRLRIRARLNVTAKVNDEVAVGIGLATGNTTDPVSTNQTLGDTLNKKNFLVDLAYLKWTPTTDLTFWGGRFANPWFSTDLVWDPDVNFDGVAFSYRPTVSPSLSLFITGGAFPIQEVELTGRDKWLFGGQVGAKYQVAEKLTARLGVAFYDFEHISGIANDSANPAGATDWSAPQFMQKGNTLMFIDPTNSLKTGLAAEYRELNITGSLDLGYWDPFRVVLTGDYVKNLGFELDEVRARYGADLDDETTGYQLGISVGHPDTLALGRWKASLFYKYLEADAVVDAFTDSDFHLGGTNAKGWIVGGDYGVGRNVWLSSRWLTANEISGDRFGVDVFQFNVNARF